MADMIVSGAGTSTVDGTYVENGTLNGKPLYIMQGQVDYPRIYFDSSGAWHIYAFNHYKGDLYYSNESVGTPDLCTTWNVSSWGTSPAPTVTAASSSQNLTLSCAAGSYSLAGAACTLTYTPAAQNLTLSCGAGSLALTGTAATLTKNLVMACESGGVAYPNIVVSGAEYSAANGTYTESGTEGGKPLYIHESNSNYLISWVGGTMWSIYDSVDYMFVYGCEEDVATPDLCSDWWDGFTQEPPALTVTAAPSITYTLTGSPVTLTVQRNYTLACGTGSYALTGSSASFEVKRNYVLACNAGSYTLTGSDVTLDPTFHYSIACSAGSYSLTGTDVSFGNTKAYELACVAGSYALTGTSVTLEVKHNFTIACNAGSYTLTGTDVSFGNTIAYSLACNSGSYLLTGTPVSLTSARSLACNSGAYTLTGLEADLFKGLVMPCGNGSYILTGSPATINSARTFALGVGSYVLVGTNAGLYILTATPDCRTYFIDAENRTWLIDSEDRTHTIDAENRTMEVRCH